MKRFSIALSLVLLVLGLGSCDRNKPTPAAEPTALTLTPTTITLKVGESKQLTATVEPKDQTFTVTFASDKPEVATVDTKGLVKAIAEGTAKITASVGKLSQVCEVTVTKDNVTTPETNELPLLKFDAQYNKGGELIDQEILAHERGLGRTAQKIAIGNDSFDGFANKDLTVVGAIYGLEFTDTGDAVIVAFSKESLSACPSTLAMLAKYGFTRFEDKTDNGTPFKVGAKDDDNTVSVQLYDAPNTALGSTLQIVLIKKKNSGGGGDLPTAHAILPTAKDFPDFTTFQTKDIAKIKAFEATLGLRSFSAKDSEEAKKNLAFTTNQAKMSETNFVWVYYVSTPKQDPMFINSQVNFVKNEDELSGAKVKEWLALNGYSKKYQYIAANKAVIAYDDATGKILCQIFITNDRKAALLQIFEDKEAKSLAQMRELATKHYEKAHSRVTLSDLTRK